MKPIFIAVKTPHPTLAFAEGELLRYCRMANPDLVIASTPDPGTFKVSLDVSPDAFPVPDVSLDDAYRIQVDQDGARFAGSNERSVLFAVYRYLRLCGFRFLKPGAEGTVVPDWRTSKRIPLPAAHFSHTFSLRYRGVCIEGSESVYNVLDYIDWMPKLGYNTFFLQFFRSDAFLRRWYTRRLNTRTAAPEPEEGSYALWDQEIQSALNQRGLLVQRAGHGWTSRVLGYQKTGWEQTTEQGSGKTDWMAMIGGERALFHGVPLDTNLCYSNKEARKAFVDSVVSYCAEHPDVRFVHVWLADEPNNVCECEDCQKTTLSDQYVCLLNEIAEELKERRLKARIIFLLYQELLYPPRTERIEDPSRFVLMFAPISRTFERSYREELQSHPDGTRLPPYVRNAFVLPDSLSGNIASLRGWQRIFHGDSFVYDYPLGRAHYGDFGYMKIARVLCEDIQCLKSHLLVNGYVSCQELRAFLPTSLPEYCMGLMLEDPSRDFDRIAEAYFSAAFGDEGPVVRAYLDRLSSLSSIDYILGKGPRVNAETAARYEKMLDFVEQSCFSGESPFFSALSYHRQCLLRLLPAMILLAQGREDAARQAFAAFRDFISENEDAYQQDLDVYRISDVLMRWTGFDPAFRE